MRFWSRMDALVREFKRRGVLHSAAVYAVSAWVAVQVATNVFPPLQFPPWTTTLVVVAAVLGFPVVVAVSWAFEITPEGVRRESEAEAPPELVRARGAPWVALLLVGVVTAASAGIGWAAWNLWLAPEEPAEEATAASSEPAFLPTRVAVLPFEHDAREEDLGWLAEGFTKDLIDALDDVSALDVVSYRGVMPYRDRVPPLDSVARAHDTGHLVHGAVEGTGGDLVVRLELLDGRTGSNLWSDRFSGSADSVLALKETILDEAVRQLRRRLGEQIRRAESRAGTSSGRAWELYHRAERRAEDGTEQRLSGLADVAAETYQQADSLYRRAEELDAGWLEPTLGRGWLTLERASLQGGEITARDPDWLRRGIRHAERALEREPGNTGALELRGALRYALSRLPSVSDSAERSLQTAAIEDLESAVGQDPDRARAWADLSDLYRRNGRYTAASRAASEAREADPFLAHEVDYLRQAGLVALDVGRFEEALALTRKGRRTFPGARWPDALELLVMASSGAPSVHPDSAWSVLSRLERTRGGEQPLGRLQVAAALARWGLADSARSILDRALDAVPERNRAFATYYEANVRLQLDERSRALDLLEGFLDENPGWREYVSQDVWWEPIRDDSAFQALVTDTTSVATP